MFVLKFCLTGYDLLIFILHMFQLPWCRELLKSYSECGNSAEIISVQNAWLTQNTAPKAVSNTEGNLCVLSRKYLISMIFVYESNTFLMNNFIVICKSSVVFISDVYILSNWDNESTVIDIASLSSTTEIQLNLLILIYSCYANRSSV